ncbi:MAG: AMP-binding protein [Actinobacteria bacterium]|nr:AMP-binding protein [Actinomycetota bacterium]
MNLANIINGHPPEQVAIISRNRATTYGTLVDQVAGLRGGLTELGVQQGDRVALIVGNSRFFVVSYLAIVGLGAVAVPLNPSSPAPELTRELVTVGASTVIIGPAAVNAWRSIDRADVPLVQRVIATEGHDIDDAATLTDLIGSAPVPVVDVADDHLAVLMFTSGTAGSPRAAMLSHGNMVSNIKQVIGTDDSIHATDIVYAVLPMFHIMGLNVVLGISLAVGATAVLVQRFDPTTALETIRDRKVTVVPGAPPMWVDFSMVDAPADAFATVRTALTGAAKMPEDAMRRLDERFGVKLAEGYGLTEASPIVTSSGGGARRPGSVGKVIDGVQMRIVDEFGEDALDGDTGEIWVSGPNVFQGYLDDPESTAKVLTADGWLRTGDIGTTDSDGFVYLVDRAKDLIIVSGFNVFPAEVEEVLLAHTGVAQVGVIGVAHPHTGEAVKAFIVPERGVHLDEDELIAYCNGELARYKCPTKVLFVDELPRNISGKLLRRSLI